MDCSRVAGRGGDAAARPNLGQCGLSSAALNPQVRWRESMATLRSQQPILYGEIADIGPYWVALRMPDLSVNIAFA